jgi:regulator of protease activity HflC (stomatin/prohibitin superfamily)
VVVTALVGNVRTVMGSMDLDQLLSHRDETNTRQLSVIDAASEPWGIKGTRIEIKDVEPPKDLIDAMARQMKAERETRCDPRGRGQASGRNHLRRGPEGGGGARSRGSARGAFRAAEARERSALAGASRIAARAFGETAVNEAALGARRTAPSAPETAAPAECAEAERPSQDH